MVSSFQLILKWCYFKKKGGDYEAEEVQLMNAHSFCLLDALLV